MPWLDAARYGDTHGYHIDSLRGMWPWRDWVIDAFNRNLPFDQFTIQQLAGDLLPDATRDQKIASGFNRNHMINFEGGAIAEEYQVEYVIDRVEATSTAFMGLTMGCARCHTHKYDPISHKEFYQFFAFFNNVPERGLDGRTGNAAPLMLLPSAAQQKILDDLDAAIEEKETALDDSVVAPLQAEWERGVSEQPTALFTNGLTAHFELDGSLSDISGKYQHGRTVSGEPTFDLGQIGRGVSFDGDTEISFGNVGGFDRGDRFYAGDVAAAARQPADGRVPEAGPTPHRAGAATNGCSTTLCSSASSVGPPGSRSRVASDQPGSAIQIRTRERLRLGDWYHVALTYDGSSKASGLFLYVDGKLFETDVVQNALERADCQRCGAEGGKQEPRASRSSVRLTICVSTVGRSRRTEIEQLAVHYPDARGPLRCRRKTVEGGWHGDSRVLPHERRADALRDDARRAEGTPAAPGRTRETNSIGDGDGRDGDAARHVRARSRRLSKSDGESPAGCSRDAAAVAQGRAVEPADAREVVGRSGAPAHRPRRRESFLADLLRQRHRQDAGRLRRAGGAAGPSRAARLARDRVHSHRVGYAGDAAAHRDVGHLPAIVQGDARAAREGSGEPSARARRALPPAGRDDSRHGAVGERPAESAKSVDRASFRISPGDCGKRWPSAKASRRNPTSKAMARTSTGAACTRSGSARFRRQSLATFDAPDREKCTVRRAQTNTPLQALVLLNDTTYVEAARALAQRVMLEGGEGREAPHRVRLPSGHGAQARRQGGERAAPAAQGSACGVPARTGRQRSSWSASVNRRATRASTWPNSPHGRPSQARFLNLDETITKQ